MSYRMWKKGRTNDYNFIDKAIAEQYNIGGVDMWLYTYQGPKGNAGSTDQTLPDYTDGSATLSSLSDYVFGEVTQRSYNVQAITLPAVYQVQEATPDLKIPGLFFNFDTMDITVHYNTMMQRVGRKIMPGDVIELPNLRDFDVLGRDVGVNRFYVVQDAFRTSEGYSATWQHHIFKLRVKPLTDSPEFSDITDPDNNTFPDNPNDPNNGNGNGSGGGISTGQTELDIMNRIIQQADSEVPYIHWTNEHIYDDLSDINELARYVISGYEFPANPSKNMFFIKLTLPVLYEKDTNDNWTIVETQYGNKLPRKAEDFSFFFLEDPASVSGYSLYQYYLSDKKWLNCILPYTDENIVPDDAEDFYCYYQKPQLYQVEDDGVTWVIPPDSHSDVPFTTKDIAANRTAHDDIRSAIPPTQTDENSGSMFPSDPEDGSYFYRTDYVPVTLWQYSAENSSWSQFNYGGRLPWTGANIEQTNFINSPDRVSIQDVVKPNIVYRKKDNK
ncbi:virion structural protein [Pectobacterium phage vB_PcaM_CBB]|uniref:Structural protein n=1 Tax=Pectobacterium phage vB_PcaM_CBB TaxID=2772511 RepID=A0A1L2CUW7_9CAUD|nr:virion structural protein [Pectobacterium phage vB_PcaM_CBB]AMM43799.1 structural protein [Pectobacterium phage vB_PcaM_CBB]